jgi:hypothetical protein
VQFRPESLSYRDGNGKCGFVSDCTIERDEDALEIERAYRIIFSWKQ